MKVWQTPTLGSWLAVVRISVLATLLAASVAASAQMAEDHLLMPTGAASSHLFLLNPATLKPKTLQAGVLLVQETRKTELTAEEHTGDSISTKVKDDYVVAGILTDLNGGVGFALTQERHYRTIETRFSSDPAKAVPHKETIKKDLSTVRLLYEFTKELRVGVAIRFLYSDYRMLGNSYLSEAFLTRYKVSMLGYGSGVAYLAKKGGVAYAFYPPLRGQTDILGEKKMVIEAGEIVLDGHYQPNDKWTIGFLVKNWLNELDDRAAGATTPIPRQSRISLYGLDPDQYLLKKQLIMLGFDYAMTKQVTVKLAVGQEEAVFNFKDIGSYDKIVVRQNGDQSQVLKYKRIRAMIRLVNGALEVHAGFGLYDRNHKFPDQMRGGDYKTSSQEAFVMLGAKL